jgi:hypothetical protein
MARFDTLGIRRATRRTHPEPLQAPFRKILEDLRGLYNIALVLCPLCGMRRARRGCPALNQQICAICCGTKRLVEIRCPDDCAYLATAREHPPASTVRQQQRDVGQLLHHVRDLNHQQTELFFLINAFLLRYEPPDLHPLIDADVAEAAAALASTFETASRGVIYEHRPAGLPADRLATSLRSVIAEAGQQAGGVNDRDIAVVLRRLDEGARAAGAANPSAPRAYFDLIGRTLKERQDTRGTGGDGDATGAPRLII